MEDVQDPVSKSPREMQIDYIKDVNSRIMKHRKDVCRTNVSSKKFEGVTNMSLADVIADRKIAEAPNRYKPKDRFDRDLPCDSDDTDLSLGQVIQKRSAARNGKIGRSNIDMNRSLDDIIQEEKEERKKSKQPVNGHHSRVEPDSSDHQINGGITGHGRKRKLDPYDDDEHYILSPVDVVLQLTEEGFIIEQEIGKQVDEEDGRSHNWKVKYKCGTVSVQCESARKKLAKQGAALELLKLLMEVDPGKNLPRFAIPEACYYDPVICDRLTSVVVSMGFETPRVETRQGRKNNRDYFTTTYYIGDDEFVESSYRIDDSKIMAAKSAYDTYSSSKPFPRDNYFVGEKCLKHKEYEVKETEATHILTVHTPAPVLDFEDSMELPDLAPEEDAEEILLDDDGRMFVRSGDGSNKLRRLTTLGIEEIIAQKLNELVDGN